MLLHRKSITFCKHAVNGFAACLILSVFYDFLGNRQGEGNRQGHRQGQGNRQEHGQGHGAGRAPDHDRL
jgi:hypothetical protein